MTDRQKLICDHIMHAITTAEGQTKFGLSGMTNLFGDKVTEWEVEKAVHYLIDNNYLRRMQGRGVFGIGDNKDLDTYDLTGFDPMSQFPAATDTSSNKQKIAAAEAKREALAKEQAEQKKKQLADAAKASQKKGKDGDNHFSNYQSEFVHLDDIPTLFGIQEQARKEDSSNVFDAIERLKQQLKPEPVPNVALKLAVLSDLSKVLDPSIGTVLEEIQADYRNQLIH